MRLTDERTLSLASMSRCWCLDVWLIIRWLLLLLFGGTAGEAADGRLEVEEE